MTGVTTILWHRLHQQEWGKCPRNMAGSHHATTHRCTTTTCHRNIPPLLMTRPFRHTVAAAFLPLRTSVLQQYHQVSVPLLHHQRFHLLLKNQLRLHRLRSRRIHWARCARLLENLSLRVLTATADRQAVMQCPCVMLHHCRSRRLLRWNNPKRPDCHRFRGRTCHMHRQCRRLCSQMVFLVE